MAKKASKQYVLEDRVILNNIYSEVDSKMKSRIPALKECINRFINKRYDSIYDYAPMDRIFWKNTDITDFFNSIDIPEKYITSILPNLYYWKEKELQACKDEFSLTCLMCLRYVLKEKPTDKIMIELISMYLAFSGKFYSTCHFELWPNYIPKKEVMDYVMNYMLSNKFDIIRTKSVCGAIKSLTATWIDRYKSELIGNITDERIVYLIHQLHNRVHAFLLNISINYYKAYEKKLYINAESDNYSDDNYRIANNNSTVIYSITEKTMMYFANNQINISFCYAASSKGVDPFDIKAIFETLLNDKTNLGDLRFIISVMLADFSNRYPDAEELTGPKFIAHSIALKPNTKDKDLVAQKNIINRWLNTSERYRKIKTQITKNNYYKAIVGYIAIAINAANKS